MQHTVHVESRALAPQILGALALALAGLAAALIAGVVVGWLVFAIMAWLAVGATLRAGRRSPVLSIGPDGLVEHRRDVSVRWDEIDSLRTVDRRALLGKTPLLELVPRTAFDQPRGPLLAAVLRGDVAVVDARDDERLMIDLQHLTATPEEVMAAIREARGTPAPTPA